MKIAEEAVFCYVSMMIDTIIFDIGGVIDQRKDSSKHRLWEQKLGLLEGDLIKKIWWTEACYKCDIGVITEDEMWNMVTSDFVLTQSEKEQLREDFDFGLAVNPNTVQLIKKLHGKYKIGLCSNAAKSMRKRVEERYQLKEFINQIVISSEVGVRKPDIEIFHITLDHLQSKPENSIFIDDYAPNVEAANKLGIKGILMIDDSKLVSDLKQHLIF